MRLVLAIAAFLLLTIVVVLGGVETGIVRTAKVLMPVLLVLMAIVIIRGLTLPGAMAGLSGTVISTVLQSSIVAGGETLVITLTGDT